MQFDLKCFLSSVLFLVTGLLVAGLLMAEVEVFTRWVWVDAMTAITFLFLAVVGLWASKGDQHEAELPQEDLVTQLRNNPSIHAGILKVGGDSMLDM